MTKTQPTTTTTTTTKKKRHFYAVEIEIESIDPHNVWLHRFDSKKARDAFVKEIDLATCFALTHSDAYALSNCDGSDAWKKTDEAGHELLLGHTMLHGWWADLVWEERDKRYSQMTKTQPKNKRLFYAVEVGSIDDVDVDETWRRLHRFDSKKARDAFVKEVDLATCFALTHSEAYKLTFKNYCAYEWKETDEAGHEVLNRHTRRYWWYYE